MNACGDPDAEFFKDLGEGANLGVDEPLPRVEAVFEEKQSWKLDQDIGEGTLEADNYKSVEDHKTTVRELFREEQKEGWMIEMDIDKAREKYGDRLTIAALGVVEEKDKVRVVHDATNQVHVNHRIRVRDQLRCPGAGELRTIMGEAETQGAKLMAFRGDVSKAHRRVKIRPSDWCYQACRLDEKTIWLNTVGTYGLGSAAYWWGRVGAAVMVRLGYYIGGVGHTIEILLYADDFLWLARRMRDIKILGAFLFLLLALGVPFRWDKFGGGAETEWVGLYIDGWVGSIGITEKRALWLSRWMKMQITNGATDMRDFTAVLGRLVFTMGPVDYIRPFVAPLFAWAAAVGSMGCRAAPLVGGFPSSLLGRRARGRGEGHKSAGDEILLGAGFWGRCESPRPGGPGGRLGMPRWSTSRRSKVVRSRPQPEECGLGIHEGRTLLYDCGARTIRHFALCRDLRRGVAVGCRRDTGAGRHHRQFGEYFRDQEAHVLQVPISRDLG